MGKIFKKNKIKINFINCNSQNKQNGPKVFNTNEIALEELKAKELNGNTNKSTKFWLKVWQDWALAREYDVDIENYPFCRAK
jgi:hypothetical protein